MQMKLKPHQELAIQFAKKHIPTVRVLGPPSAGMVEKLLGKVQSRGTPRTDREAQG